VTLFNFLTVAKDCFVVGAILVSAAEKSIWNVLIAIGSRATPQRPFLSMDDLCLA